MEENQRGWFVPTLPLGPKRWRKNWIFTLLLWSFYLRLFSIPCLGDIKLCLPGQGAGNKWNISVDSGRKIYFEFMVPKRCFLRGGGGLGGAVDPQPPPEGEV